MKLEQIPSWIEKGLLVKSENKMSDRPEKVYIALDGDNTGKLVENALLTNDVEQAKDISQKIQNAHKEIRDTVKKYGGHIVFDGGDNMLITLSYNKDLIQSFIDSYVHHTGQTASIGVGKVQDGPITAHFALVYAKNIPGKGKIVLYSDEIKEQLDLLRTEQKELKEVEKKLKYQAQQETFDLKAFEIIKGALNELNITITDDKVYDIFYRLVEVNNLNTFEEISQFFGKPREELKTDIRDMYESQKTGGLCVWLKQGTSIDDLAKIEKLYELYVKDIHDEDLLNEVKVIIDLFASDMAKFFKDESVEWSHYYDVHDKINRVRNQINSSKDFDETMFYIDSFLNIMHHSGDMLGQLLEVGINPETEEEERKTYEIEKQILKWKDLAQKLFDKKEIKTRYGNHLQPSFPGQSVIPGGKKQRSPHRRTDYLTIEEYNRDQVNYKDTDIQYNSGNQTKDSQDMSMGSEPGNAIYIP